MQLDRLIAAQEAASSIETELGSRFGADAGGIAEVLKAGDEAMVFSGTFQGRDAVFKQLLTPDAVQKLAETRDELTFLCEAFADGPVRAVAFLGDLPGSQTLILERAPGMRASVAMKSGGRAMRSHVVARCGDWLAQVAPLRQQVRPFWGRKIARRITEDTGAVPPEAADLFERAWQRMAAIGKTHKGIGIQHTMAHGDFAPVNLNVDGDTVWAFDIQGGHSLPLARMCARFLVASSIFKEGVPGPLGLDKDDVQAFDVARILPPQEQGAVFAFFVAEQFLRRLKLTHPSEAQLKRALPRLEALTQGLALTEEHT
ncbi:hypothetical protein NBRC116594_13040 [Shimia sp. NS0008-38b]|uniref:hypothetical protein n=1 Tax=Shimia sp. NS0008-38b TaxID=3127653 RepID=UPI00310706CB